MDCLAIDSFCLGISLADLDFPCLFHPAEQGFCAVSSFHADFLKTALDNIKICIIHHAPAFHDVVIIIEFLFVGCQGFPDVFIRSFIHRHVFFGFQKGFHILWFQCQPVMKYSLFRQKVRCQYQCHCHGLFPRGVHLFQLFGIDFVKLCCCRKAGVISFQPFYKIPSSKAKVLQTGICHVLGISK